MKPASRLDGIETSLIRQISALAGPHAIHLGLGEPNVEPDETLLEMARSAATEESWTYTANAGLPSLRDAIAARAEGVASPVVVGFREAVRRLGCAEFG